MAFCFHQFITSLFNGSEVDKPLLNEALHRVGGLTDGLCDGLEILPGEFGEHPVGHVVVWVGLLAHPDLDPGELVGTQVLDDALEAVMTPGGAALADAQLAQGCFPAP